MLHQPHPLRSTPSPDRSLALLLLIVSLAGGLLILLGWRLLLGAGGLLGNQHGLHLMAENCLLLLNSPNLPDRLLAYGLVAAMLLIVGRAAWALVSLAWRGGAAARELGQLAEPLPAVLAAAASKVGLAGRVLLVPGEQPFAFCFGLLRRRICISRGLLLTLGTGSELEAVLWHEGYHLRSRDPLKMAVAATLARAFFFLPVVADLYRHYLTVRELAADRYTLLKQGVTGPLATALYRLATASLWQAAAMPVASIIEQGESLNARFDALLGEPNPCPLRFPQQHLIRSLLLLGAVTLLLTLTYVAHEGRVLTTVAHWLQGYC